MLGTDDYARLKLGVGRPADPRFSVADYVLANFNEPESDLVRFVGDSCDAVMFWVRNGVEKAANKYNGSKKE
jgi:PTH1 family peptidyl-tRNA hydrolase